MILVLSPSCFSELGSLWPEHCGAALTKQRTARPRHQKIMLWFENQFRLFGFSLDFFCFSCPKASATLARWNFSVKLTLFTLYYFTLCLTPRILLFTAHGANLVPTSYYVHSTLLLEPYSLSLTASSLFFCEYVSSSSGSSYT